MTSGDRWLRVERIYHAALERPVADRPAFIHAEAGGDLELAAEILALLAFDDRPAAFTRQSAMELSARALAVDADREHPAQPAAIGAYEIVRPLGSGGMGDVYLARDRRLGRHVALKVLRPELTDSAWAAALRQEAMAASALNHPNIVTIYEIGEHEGTGFIAAEYVEGMTLRERLKRGPLTLRELLGVAVQIAEGLATAHEAGVVHRDIKPDNIMLRADGLVKILDFGIAMRTSVSSAASLAGNGPTGRVAIGTTGYMSPEQRAGGDVDARTDVWSLGVVIHEMATGEVPAGARKKLPAALARIVTRAVAPERTARYATAAELARELRALHRQDGDGRARAVRARAWLAAAAVGLAAVAVYFAVAARDRRGPLGITSIGVMPVATVGEARDAAYVADGITASVRTRLAQFPSIRQAAPSEAARYDRLGVSPAEAGREMQVGAVLVGTLERRDATSIVRLELLRSADGAGLWKRQFIRPSDDILTLHTEIAREVVDALGLSPQPIHAGAGHTSNPAAYQAYVKGRYHIQRRTPDDLRKGLAYLREAVTLDPEYARAYAQMADGYILLAMTSDVAPKQSFPQARHAAERALAIDPALSDARVSMGIIKFWFDWDWSGAEAEFRRAIAADPPDPAAHTFYGHLLSNLGDHTRALQEMRRALDYEPHSAVANALFAQVLYYQGRYDESLAHLEKTRDLDPGLWLTYNMMGRVHGRKERYREALAAFTRATELGGSLIVTAMSGYTLAVSGERAEARRILDQLNTRASQTYVPASNIALVHLGLGEYDQALDRLEEAVEARDMLLTFLTVEPRWSALAGQPRFTAVLEKVGLRQ